MQTLFYEAHFLHQPNATLTDSVRFVKKAVGGRAPKARESRRRGGGVSSISWGVKPPNPLPDKSNTAHRAFQPSLLWLFTFIVHRRRSPDVVAFAFESRQSSQCCTQLGCLDHIITMSTCLLFFTLELQWRWCLWCINTPLSNDQCCVCHKHDIRRADDISFISLRSSGCLCAALCVSLSRSLSLPCTTTLTCTTKSEELKKPNDPMNVVDADMMTDAVKVIESPSVLSCDVLYKTNY